MKTISLAIASIVDAHTSLGYTGQITKASSGQIDTQLNRGKQIRAKAIFDLVGSVVSWIDNLRAKVSEYARDQRAKAQILNLNARLLKDIGLHENDLHGLRSGALSLDEIGQRREQAAATATVKHLPTAKPVRKSILDLESVNAGCYELAKCS